MTQKPENRGQLIAVVGPSGVGKDTLMEAAAARRGDIGLARRIITRRAEATGEMFEGVTAEEFATQYDEGRFVLTWQAHGLAYGIPSTINAELEQGRTLLFNGSRRMLDEARETYPDLMVASITASPQTLAKRLKTRGRETSADICARLERAARYKPSGPRVFEISNDGALEDAVSALLAILQPPKE